MADRKKYTKKVLAARKKDNDAWMRQLEEVDAATGWSPIAYTRKFPTPIYEGKIPATAKAMTLYDENSPSQSRIVVPKGSRKYTIGDVMAAYEDNHGLPMRHELMHVLQNLDQDPFDNATRAMQQPAINAPERLRWVQNTPGYGSGDSEAQAFLLSRSQRLNRDLAKQMGIFDPDYNKPPQLMDKLFPSAYDRNYLTEQFRSDYLKHFPEGLRRIIEDVVGPPR